MFYQGHGAYEVETTLVSRSILIKPPPSSLVADESARDSPHLACTCGQPPSEKGQFIRQDRY